MVLLPPWRRYKLCDGCRRLGSTLGSLLEGAQLPMREWGHPPAKQETRSIRLEFTLRLVPVLFAISAALFWLVTPANAHPGGLAADGCHNDWNNGGRHCHRGPSAGQSKSPPSNGGVYYANCKAARAAGAAPIYRGQPGYGKHLDRDGDGKACE